jgi:hypothetical protein
MLPGLAVHPELSEVGGELGGTNTNVECADKASVLQEVQEEK